ncbi:MAG: UDP-2,3-diacylglucosamine diphosphatase [Rhodospirillales bacterium]|nr:MAG: UDP-2,3-diacylglucosamine diphosphatase [Rhodospirillales bacterium]
MNALSQNRFRFRTIWISDVHLGTRGSNTELLLDFLRRTDSDYLYLVGDIVDIWRMRKAWYWDQSHNDVIQKILRKARKGTRVIYIPGNHDESFRDFTRHRFGRVAVLDEAFHITADGKRFLVMHGDQFDGIVKYAKWLAFVGDTAYNVALNFNTWFNRVRRRLGFSYWSLSAYLKHKVKNAVEYISNYETAVVAEARRRGADGVICGHIHTAEIRDIDGITYCNDGDWVESCTALVEHVDGRLEILYWSKLFEADLSTSATEGAACDSSSSPTPGFLKSMASFARLKL